MDCQVTIDVSPYVAAIIEHFAAVNHTAPDAYAAQLFEALIVDNLEPRYLETHAKALAAALKDDATRTAVARMLMDAQG